MLQSMGSQRAGTELKEQISSVFCFSVVVAVVFGSASFPNTHTYTEFLACNRSITVGLD